MNHSDIHSRASKILLLVTDCDGVLTDGGVYYGPEGEVMKKFNIRDGMGVERLRNAGIETAIITGEMSPSVAQRAKKLKIEELHLGVKEKVARLEQIMASRNLTPEQIAYIGDDVNDENVMKLCGLKGCPADALPQIRTIADYICSLPGGHGAFREFAELILANRP